MRINDEQKEDKDNNIIIQVEEQILEENSKNEFQNNYAKKQENM